MFRKLFSIAIGLILSCQVALSQDQGVISGGFEANFNVFLRDSLIGASNTPQYDRQITGGEAWLNLNYAYKGYLVGMRFDMFNNSNLLNPTDSYTDQGIGNWFVQKKINKFGIEVGYIYDQIGSGIIYRAYEQRPLLIDNALVGAKVTYDINEDWKIKAFSGRQKFQFDTHPGVVRGGSIDGYLSLGSEESPIALSPGIGIVNRTLSDDVMSTIISEVATYTGEDRFIPKYNVYLASFYNTLTYKSFTWYVEAAYKTEDTFFDDTAFKINADGSASVGRLVNDAGSVLYTSLSYAAGKLGITLEGKRTENFNFRTDPNLQLTRGLINWLPPMNRFNTYRMTARYAPAVRDLSELAIQADVRYRFSKAWSANINYSNVTTKSGDPLYKEIYTEVVYKMKRKWSLAAGVQHQQYNQDVYETKPGVPIVSTITPYFDFLYKINRKRSLRIEGQYMSTEQDFGSWLFLLAEYGVAPNWIFEISSMYNSAPGPKSPRDPDTGELLSLLYPTAGITYIKSSNRYSLRYVKQVEGIVCSGGVCRLEPAFSGIRFAMASNF